MEERNKTLKQQSKRRGKESTLVLIDAERRTIDESWQIFNPKHKFQLNLSVFTLSKPLSPNPKSKTKKQGRKTEWKRCPKQNCKKSLTAAIHQVARSCHVARPDRANCLAGWSCQVLGARPCGLGARPRFARFRALPCSWCPRLPRTSTFLLNPSKMLFLLVKPEGSPWKHRKVII